MYDLKHSQLRSCLIHLNAYFHKINFLEFLSYETKNIKNSIYTLNNVTTEL